MVRNIDAAMQQIEKRTVIMIKIAISCNKEIYKKEGLLRINKVEIFGDCLILLISYSLLKGTDSWRGFVSREIQAQHSRE